ncbi:MAG: 12 protein [Acidimicrobiales bacterium]|nr:12 protein [Acidimicrobiales bacterium]
MQETLIDSPRARNRMTLNGTLEDFSPAGILKVLSSEARTGAVRFGGDCTVYLHRGQLYFGRDGSTDELLATALVRPGRLTADDWARAIDKAGDRPMVGELLVREGAIQADLLASVVLSVVYDPLIALFRHGTGDFEFEPDTVHWLGPFRAFPVDAIVTEVRKRVREADEWSTTMPTLDVWVEARRTLPGNASQVTLQREDWELVTALSGPRTIAELSTELGRGRYSTARVVYRLSQAGLVEVISETAEADVVPIRPGGMPHAHRDIAPVEHDPILSLGLPHRSTPSPTAGDAIDERIEDAIATALATTSLPDPPANRPRARMADLDTRDQPDHGAAGVPGGANPFGPPPAAEPPKNANAAWLEDLYAQFIDEPEAPNSTGNGNGGGRKRRKNEPNPVDIAFKAEEQDGEAKVSTLRRLMSALKKL